MLSYQHSYHAGGFADVMKHVMLVRMLTYSVQKEQPLFYLETHAGRGRYDVTDRHAEKTQEANEGVQVLWGTRDHLPVEFREYLHICQQINDSNTLRYYPGSPLIAKACLRPCDRSTWCELHPSEFEHLSELAHHQRRIFCQQVDGLTQLQALLPPPERRGLIFIDPSYEVKNDYRAVALAVKAAYQRFSSGVYGIWYPLIAERGHEILLRGLAAIATTKHLRVELMLNKRGARGMQGSGLWIINPPYGLDKEAITVMKTLTTLLNPGESSYCVE